MNRVFQRVISVALTAAALSAPAPAQMTSIVGSPHDLSAGSRSAVRAAVEDQVCIFCHTPHNASPVGALWNRGQSSQAYSVYTSRALNARPGQPTGSSKLCLSCHDGTIALGSVLTQATPIQMLGGVTTMPAGHANLGTDLRDDHPISFVFDTTLAGRDGRLRDPASLPPKMKLDANRELQCTTCHEAHNNAFGKFLVMANNNSEVCTSCHQVGRTDIAGHAQCTDCHQNHSAPSGPYLLRRTTISKTCLSCHDGHLINAPDVGADMRKASIHDTDSPVDPTGPAGSVATCTSCHDPHTMSAGIASAAPVVGPRTVSLGRLGRIDGVNASGSPVRQVSSESEVCYRCHSEGDRTARLVPRRLGQSNTRVQFGTSAVSRHPVGVPGRSVQGPSLKPGWTTASTMTCSDCHGSDTVGGAAGVHGSGNPGLLVLRNETADYTSESETAYALCYKCHDRGSILDNRSFPGHRSHVVDFRTPCSVCHDAHGIPAGQGSVTGNSHLINFDTRVVFPDRATGRLEYRDTGGFTGQCMLTCHGVDHSPLGYPNNAPGAAPTALPGRLRAR